MQYLNSKITKTIKWKQHPYLITEGLQIIKQKSSQRKDYWQFLKKKIIKRPSAAKNSYLTAGHANHDDVSINNQSLSNLTIESIKNTMPFQTHLAKLTMEIEDNNDRLNNKIKGTAQIKLSVQPYKNIMDDKIKHTENSTDKIKETLGREIQKTKKSNNDTKSQLIKSKKHQGEKLRKQRRVTIILIIN